ncbi:MULTISPECIES: hypothetical protein [Streptomyces]|uniref:hypothetical protein n=1 Tax=Streptomyces TaxID=1883 RepID=UPI0036CD8470
MERFERRIDLCRSLTCGFVSEVPDWATPSEGLSEILDARMTLEAEVSAAPSDAEILDYLK